MARYRSPFYMDPQFAQIGSNLAKAFMPGDPSDIARGRYYRVKADDAERTFKAKGSIADRFRTGGGAAVEPSAIAGITADSVLAGNVGDVAKATLYYNSNTGQPATSVARSFVGAGRAIGENQGVTLEDREAVAGRADSARMARTATSASIGAGPGYARVAEDRRQHGERMQWDREKYGQEREFKEKTRFDSPHNVGEGVAPYFNPEDPRAASVPPGTVPVPKTLPPHNTPPGHTVDYQPGDPRIPQGAPPSRTLPPPPGEAKRHTLAPGAVMVDNDGNVIGEGRPKEPTPVDVSQADLDAIEYRALGDLGALKVSGDSATIDEQFMQMHAEKIQRARAAMAAVYQRTRNAQEGSLAYMREMGVQTGDRFERGGWFSDPKMTRGGKPLPPPPEPGAPVTPAPAVGGSGASGGGDVLQQARDAIAKGADPAKVRARLQQMGVDPRGL
jgi:hypothetical protein